MMMRSIRGGAPSFCFALLLFIAEFQTSDAVKCTRQINGKTYKPVTCDYCVKYQCYKEKDNPKIEIWGRGCPSHFSDDCQDEKWSKAPEFVKNEPNRCYWDTMVLHLSSSDETCFDDKFDQCVEKTRERVQNSYIFRDNLKCSAKTNPNPGTSVSDGPDSTDLSTTTAAGDANSGVSNSIIKLAGIIMVAIGWVIY